MSNDEEIEDINDRLNQIKKESCHKITEKQYYKHFNPLNDQDCLVRSKTDMVKAATYDGTTPWLDYKSHFEACARLVSAPIFFLNKYIYFNTTGTQSRHVRELISGANMKMVFTWQWA